MVGVLASGSRGTGSSLAGDIPLRSCARYFTSTVLLSVQVHKWVLEGRGGGLTLQWANITFQGEDEKPLVASTLHRFVLQKLG